MGEPQNTPLIKISLFLKKKDDITDDFFHSHWKGKHVEVALRSREFSEKVVRYNQCHTSPEHKEIAAIFSSPIQDFDGVAEVWVKSIEDWKVIMADPEFVRVLGADEDLFIQKPIHVMVGYDHTVIGEPVKLK